jgi:hypothetical protein
VYGLLRQTGTRASARTQQRTYELRAVAIPRSFNQTGRVAYALLPEQPTQITVKGRDGHILMDEKLGSPPHAPCSPGETSSLIVFGPTSEH